MRISTSKLIYDVPKDNISDVKTYKNDKVVLLISNFYVSGIVSSSSDYVFSFPTSTPPPTTICGKEYQFNKGRMVVFPPEVEVFAKESSPTGEYMTLIMNRVFLDRVAKEAADIKKVSFSFFDNPCNKSTLSTISKLLGEYKEHSPCSLMVESIVTQLAVELLRDTEVIKDSKSTPLRRKEQYIEKSIEYMNAYYGANIKIDDICRSINLSSYYFIRLFKECTGQTPHDYLMRLRIEKAKELIRFGSGPISEVARQCGFINMSHFSSSFKQITGILPMEYKKI